MTGAIRGCARRAGALAAFITLAVGCGDDADSAGPAQCGVQGEVRGSACRRLSDCGAGNEGTVSFCDQCPPRAETEVCLAGVCTPFSASGGIEIGALALPDAAAGARSVILAALEPVMADGTRVRCAELTSDRCGADTVGLNPTNARFQNLLDPHAPGLVYPGLRTPSAPGTDRLLWVFATTDRQGKGAVVAEGCVEGLSVPDGDTVVVPSLTLDPR